MATAVALFALAVRLPRAPLSAPRAPPVALTATATSCEALLRATFEGAVDADAVADACAPTIEWDDMSASGTVTGPSAVRELIAQVGESCLRVAGAHLGERVEVRMLDVRVLVPL